MRRRRSWCSVPLVLAVSMLGVMGPASASNQLVPLDLYMYVDYSLPVLPDKKSDTKFLVEALNAVRALLHERAADTDLPDYIRVFLFADRVGRFAYWSGTLNASDAGQFWDGLIEGLKAGGLAPESDDGLDRGRTNFRPVFDHIGPPGYEKERFAAALIISNAVQDTGQNRGCTTTAMLGDAEARQLTAEIREIRQRTSLVITPCAAQDNHFLYPLADFWESAQTTAFHAFRSRPLRSPTSTRDTVAAALRHLEYGFVAVTAAPSVSSYGPHPVSAVAYTHGYEAAAVQLCVVGVETLKGKAIQFDVEKDVSIVREDSGLPIGQCRPHSLKSGRHPLDVTLQFSRAKMGEMFKMLTTGRAQVEIRGADHLYFSRRRFETVFDLRATPFEPLFFGEWWVQVVFWCFVVCALLLLLSALHWRFGVFGFGWDVTCRLYRVKGSGPKLTVKPLCRTMSPVRSSWVRGYYVRPQAMIAKPTGALATGKAAERFPLRVTDELRLWPLDRQSIAVTAPRRSRITRLTKPSAGLDVNVSRPQGMTLGQWRRRPPIRLRMDGDTNENATAVGLVIRWKKERGWLGTLKRSISITPVRWLRYAVWVLAVGAGVYLGAVALIAWSYDVSAERAPAGWQIHTIWVSTAIISSFHFPHIARIVREGKEWFVTGFLEVFHK